MFKPVGILAGALVVMAGCATAPRHPAKEHAPDWEFAPQEKPAPEPVVVVPVPAPPPQTSSAPTHATPERTWLSLERWARDRGFGPGRWLSKVPLETFALPTTNGLLTLSAGSLSADWDGMEFRLGFAPQMIDGQVFVHALDVHKNLEPLLHGFAVPAKTNRIIVIDPGHSGTNSGTTSVAGGVEKQFTLDWARRLAPLLEATGWQVFLTHTKDTDISLADRVTFATQHHADLFVSLHFNSSGGGGRTQAGLETYCLTPTGMASSLTRGYEDDIHQISPNNACDEQNLQLAARIHRELLRIEGMTDRGVRRARFLTVLRGQKCPAVLVEGGYLSNQREARKIAEPAYRQKLAEAIAKALE